MAAFKSTERYIATRDLEVAVNASVTLQRPLLVKGEPGTGKTVLAHEVAQALGHPLIEWHIKSTTKAQQGLYEYDAVSRLRDGQLGDPRVHDIANYIVRGKLWDAFEAPEPVVVLIDEVDKADIEFPNDLLLELDRMQFFVYETRKTVVATHRPIVIITSNNEKELPDAFLRRCFFHYIRFPDRETMERIVQAHYPDIRQRPGARGAERVLPDPRGAGLKKKPATSELLDWLKLLMVEDLPPEALRTQGDAPGDPAAARRAAEERAGRAPVRAAGVPGARGESAVMFAHFIICAAQAGVPASITEYLALMAAMKANVADYSVEDFYYLSRAALVKDERHLDRFDRVFGECFKGLEAPEGDLRREIPEEWLRKMAEKLLTPEEMQQIKAMGGLEALMERLRELLASRRAGTRAARNGSAPPEPRRSAPMATIPRACGSARTSPPSPRREGVGQARVPRPGRRHRDRHAQHQAGAAPAAPVRAPGRGDGARSAGHHPLHREQRRDARPEDGGGAAQHGEGAAAAGCRRLDGRACAAVRRTVLRRAQRVQAPGVFYFHNCVYERMWKNNRRRHDEQMSDLARCCGSTARTTS